MQQQRNVLLFLILVLALLFGWPLIRQRIWPAPLNQANQANQAPREGEKKKEGPKPGMVVRLPVPPRPTPNDELLHLGGDEAFPLDVKLDPLGGGVRGVVLRHFQEADRMGKPAWKDHKVPMPLELVPAWANLQTPSHLLYAFDVNSPGADRPLDTLGRRRWKVVKHGGKKVITEERDGKKVQRVSFQAEAQGVTITKTYTLTEGDYHLGLEVQLERPKSAKGTLKFRYQLTGAHGLPVEGRWYTGVFRNVLIAQQDNRDRIYRDLQDLRQVSLWGGGNPVDRQQGRLIRYAGVAVQYFASVIAVDNDQGKDEEGKPRPQDFLRRALASLELAVAKGTIKKGSITPAPPPAPAERDKSLLALGASTLGLLASPGGQGPLLAASALYPGRVPPAAEKDEGTVGCGSFVLITDGGKHEQTFEVLPEDASLLGVLHDEQQVAVMYRTESYDPALKGCPAVVVRGGVRTGESAAATHALWEDDVTVRVATEPVELKPGDSVVHRYQLYNGPVKVSQLWQLSGDRAVSGQLIDHYLDDLHLNTLTDYQSPGWAGDFAGAIGWSWVVIKCTNVMHWILSGIHTVIGSYGLCIILLTVLVRGLMFPLSRKQALMGMRMQELAPELKKLGEKYKDDKQALGMAQMELYRKHGVNPFGTCWFLLLQMPIFMGLYYALQESILFRLAPFWPTWIDNLAAPDMMIYWGESIPMISRPADYGGFLYLGPYFNLLPVIAVALMIAQQKMMTPPPADEQQAMQQKMMKWMMVIFGLMFYKVAAGLCIYFIASSLWGFAERKLLPKRKAGAAPTPEPPGGSAPASTANVPVGAAGDGRGRAARKGGRNKRRGEAAPARPGAEPAPGTALGRLRQWWRLRRERLGDWWADVLEQARKK